MALLHEPAAPERILGVVCRDGSFYQADRVILAAGAMTSPRILQDHMNSNGLEATLPCAAMVGANFQAESEQRAGRLLAVHRPRRPAQDRDLLQRPLSAHHGAVSGVAGRRDPRDPAARRRAQVRDQRDRRPCARLLRHHRGRLHPHNRIISGGGDDGIPTADYSLDRLPPAQAEHSRAAADFTRCLLHVGLAGVDRYLGLAGSAHALGSMVTGTDPQTSVVDPDGKVHGMEGLYVGDGSALPHSSRVNPALTIYAWGLRLGQHLADQAS